MIFLQLKDMSPDIMNGIFKLKNTSHYSLQHTLHFSADAIQSVYNRTESVSYLGRKIWEQMPSEIIK